VLDSNSEAAARGVLLSGDRQPAMMSHLVGRFPCLPAPASVAVVSWGGELQAVWYFIAVAAAADTAGFEAATGFEAAPAPEVAYATPGEFADSF
jgi:hypothetical protein